MARHWLLSALLLCSMALLTPVVRAEDPSPHPVLATLEQTLSQLLKSRIPEGDFTVTLQDGTLTARYHARKFQVYSRYMSGRLAEQLHEETGPDADGLLLRLNVQPGKTYRGQALLPQDCREAYWTTFCDYRPLASGDAHLLIRLSYGAITDTQLLADIEHLIGSTAAGRPYAQEQMARRQQLLDAAIAQVKEGLRTLAVQYPQLQHTATGSLETALDRVRPNGNRISIALRSPRGKNASQPTPAEGGAYNLALSVEDSWYHMTCYQLPWASGTQCPLRPLYPNLFLYGQVQASANDPALDAALKKLVQDALAPLAQLNEEVGAAKAKEQ